MGETAAQRILVIRLSAIGDIVFASPLIDALRRRYPTAQISWLVQPESRALLAHHPQLDRVIVWPRSEWRELWRQRRWLTLWRRLRALRRQLRDQRFDLVIDAQGLLKSGLLAWLTGAPRRVGLASREGSGRLMTEVVSGGGEAGRIGSEYLHLAQQLDLPGEPFEMRVGLAEADRQAADALIEGAGVQAGYIAICPFTTRPQKHWIDASWVELIRRSELPLVLLGGPGDRAHAARLVEAAAVGERLHNLAGETSLRVAAALIERAALLVGVDTGLTHMGIAFNRPTLAIFGSTCPYTNTTRANARVLYHPRDCSPCRRRPTCDGAYDCMHAVTPDEVLENAAELLEQAR